jgi:hypothetical protein
MNQVNSALKNSSQARDLQKYSDNMNSCQTEDKQRAASTGWSSINTG